MLTLVVILVLSVVTELMMHWVSSALDHAFSLREEVDARRQIDEAVAVSLYLLGTAPLSFRGIETSATARPPVTSAPATIARYDPTWTHIRLDNHPYRLDDRVLRFQDARGLINVNLGSEYDLFALLGLFDVATQDRNPLISKLQDYIDADGLTRLNGAEAAQYAAAGREPPANRPLRTPWEVRRIIDWDKVDGIAREDSAWPLLTTTGDFIGFNVNTAPRALLSLMPGMTSDAADKVIRWRDKQPITGPSEFSGLTGIAMPKGPSRFLPFPADHFVITLSATKVSLERRIAVHLTPQASSQPWSIDYDLETPRSLHSDGEPKPANLPLPQLLSPAP